MDPNDFAVLAKIFNEGGPLAFFAALVGWVLWAVISSRKDTVTSPLVTKAEHDKLEEQVHEIDRRLIRLEVRSEK